MIEHKPQVADDWYQTASEELSGNKASPASGIQALLGYLSFMRSTPTTGVEPDRIYWNLSDMTNRYRTE